MIRHGETADNGPASLVIPAAGLGTRMRIVDPAVPKEMLPVGHKPAIQYAVEEGISAGIEKIIIIISRQKEIIRRYFEDKRFAEKMFPRAVGEVERINRQCRVIFRCQGKPLGEADAISYARDIAGGGAVAVIYPDNVYVPAPGALKILKQVYGRYKKDVIALVRTGSDDTAGTGNSGRVDTEPVDGVLFRIKRFHPKGEGRFIPRFKGELRACGIYVSGPYLFEYIEMLRDSVKEKEFTDLPVRSLILTERGTFGHLMPGRVFDIGNPDGYRQCLEYTLMLQKRAGESAGQHL